LDYEDGKEELIVNIKKAKSSKKSNSTE
jgi:hypothetical protein